MNLRDAYYTVFNPASKFPPENDAIFSVKKEEDSITLRYDVPFVIAEEWIKSSVPSQAYREKMEKHISNKFPNCAVSTKHMWNPIYGEGGLIVLENKDLTVDEVKQTLGLS
jgi:hypothetical protein